MQTKELKQNSQNRLKLLMSEGARVVKLKTLLFQ